MLDTIASHPTTWFLVGVWMTHQYHTSELVAAFWRGFNG